MLFVPAILLSLIAPALASSSPFDSLTISAPDGSTKASFIYQGATLTNFWTKDKYGKFRDIIVGYDDKKLYSNSSIYGRQFFGPVVGRYANRIKNGTFSIDGVEYHVPENEHGGLDTLHGGYDGYDLRDWKLVSKSAHSLSFSLVDPDGTQGFPGVVETTVTYTLDKDGEFHMSIHANAPQKKTPIMLSGHHFWNFEAYEESQDLFGHYAQFQASRVIEGDSLLVPTGKLLNVSQAPYTPLDFSKAKSVGASLASADWCGGGCTGFDNCWIYDNNTGKKPVFSLWSVNSGIRLDVTTNQAALQIYTCNGIYNATNPIPRKASQGKGHYTDYSCLVIEQENWIGAIDDNTQSWGIDEIYGPNTKNGEKYYWDSVYKFSVQK